MKRRTLRLDDLKTLAAVCHEYDAIDWPPRAEGGWATATLNGHPYKARVEPEPVPAEPVEDDYADLAPEAVPPATAPGPVTGRIILCGNTCEHDHTGVNSPTGCCAEHGPYLYYCGDCAEPVEES